MGHTIRFQRNGRGKARCAPDPAYPDGKDLDIAGGEKACMVLLPYPAAECGAWMVGCEDCGRGLIAITAAGRADDPKSIKIPCKAVCKEQLN